MQQDTISRYCPFKLISNLSEDHAVDRIQWMKYAPYPSTLLGIHSHTQLYLSWGSQDPTLIYNTRLPLQLLAFLLPLHPKIYSFFLASSRQIP